MILELIGDMVRAAGVASLPTVKRALGPVTRLIPIAQPVLLVGPGSAAKLGQAIADFGHRQVLLVTDASVRSLGLTSPLTDALAAAGVACEMFDEVLPDAPIAMIERGIECFAAQRCDAVVACGGGSVMDAAKVIALAAANHKRPRQLVGYFRSWRAPAPIYAVPTTAGTGSEVTVVAIISDPDEGRKYMVADSRIVPEMAALDPTLMIGLPPAVTAATGMDALTHAVEAFISGWSTPATDRLALAAVGMILTHLPRAFDHGSDLAAREKMALAATYAGMAFTRANVGNVHAIAHQLGGKYHTPHGLANAIALPPVLRWSLPACSPRLARLARHIGVKAKNDNDKALAAGFIDAVQALNDRLDIPRTLAALKGVHIPSLAKAACWEADTNYPVPRQMSQGDCEGLLRTLLPPAAATAAPRPAKSRTKRGGAGGSKRRDRQ